MTPRVSTLTPVKVLLIFSTLTFLASLCFIIIYLYPTFTNKAQGKPTIELGVGDSKTTIFASPPISSITPTLILTPEGSTTPGRSKTPIPTLLPLSTLTETKAPPSGQIAFTCTRDGYNQLCLMNADSSNLVRLTTKRANDYYPSVSPDGQHIIFVSNQSTRFEIYTVNLEGGNETRLTLDIGNLTAPEISPDGQWITFAAKVDGERDGSNPHRLTNAAWNEIDPVWSPDGSQISFAAARGGYVEIFAMNPDGTDIRQISRDIRRIGGRHSWSPDGKTIVFYAGVKGDRDIYLVNVQTGESSRLTEGGNNTGPCFSSDGEWITFSSSRDGDHEIYIMRVDGSDLTLLTFNDDDDWQPRWGIRPEGISTVTP